MDTIDLRRSPLREDRLQLEERAEPVAGAENSCDDDCRDRLDPNDPQCGIWFFRPNCLQHFRTPKWVLFWLCWASAIQGMSFSFFYKKKIGCCRRNYEATARWTWWQTLMRLAINLHSGSNQSVPCTTPPFPLLSRFPFQRLSWDRACCLTWMGFFIFSPLCFYNVHRYCIIWNRISSIGLNLNGLIKKLDRVALTLTTHRQGVSNRGKLED